MYLYHHPDIWYDYAMWHAKNGSLDSAAKIFQRALKAIPGNKYYVDCCCSIHLHTVTSQCIRKYLSGRLI